MRTFSSRVSYFVTTVVTFLLLIGMLPHSASPAFAQEHPFDANANLATVPPDPFLTNNGLIPPASQYPGPFFALSHNWPQKPLPPMKNPPWLKAIGGVQITPQNAGAYVEAVKQFVAPNARRLLLDYKRWDAAKAHWYNEPWLGSQRESIHGTYGAGQFAPQIFPGTGLKTIFDTQVLTYYDERAAYSLYKVWGEGAMQPNVQTANFQFDEGSVVVKAAIFLSDDPKIQSNWWPVTDGAAKWPVYVGIPVRPDTNPPPAVLNGYIMQFDLIVKDTIAAPKTGWVFATLVYDVNAKGDAWDKMVPLGAMWGNDPGMDSAKDPNAKLSENWINPKAPLYSTQTLGWGGRLSGPNDGARNDIQVGTKVLINEPDSSCMSCHGPAEWQPAQHKMLSFLLPSYPNPNPGPPFKTCPNGQPNDPYICSPAQGSADWSNWFQSRPGTEPQDPNTGSIATDYDMVFAFKTLPAWWKATGGQGQPTPFGLRGLRHGVPEPQQYNQYNGAPLKKLP